MSSSRSDKSLADLTFVGGAEGVKDSLVPVNFLTGVRYLSHLANLGDFGAVG